MKWILNIAGVVLLVIGAIWFLQGLGILPGSFMTGQRQWCVFGAMAMAAGVGNLWAARRQPSPSKPPKG
ncbi:MAG: hypothetical protein EOO27_06895 [Comamonadaceae bacterium]|nr:MAG: hypothetical protein EOO27_06895 [Comamonadaceae bacterium]